MPAEDALPPAEPRSPQAAVVAQTEITTWAGSVHRLKAWVWGVEEKAEHIEEKLQGGVRRISHALSSSPIKVGRSTLSSMAASAKNYYTSSHHFLRLCRSTFAAMDMDNSKSLDLTEVYCATLLLYTKILVYVPCAIPPPKKVVDEMVHDLDADGSGAIDEEEFIALATLLSTQVAARVSTQAMFYFAIGPLIATAVLHAVDNYLLPEYTQCEGWICRDYGVPMRNSILVCVLMAVVMPSLLGMIDRSGDLPNPPAHRRPSDITGTKTD